MDVAQYTYLGIREGWGGEQPFGLHEHDRRQHVYLVGKSGTGKSSLLRNMLIQDMLCGRGVGLLDPHGDLAVDLLDCIPPSRIDDTVYFNPVDLDHPIPFNLLRLRRAGKAHVVASGIVSACKAIWGDSWGPRMEMILSACVAALSECNNVSLLGIQRMLIDKGYRRWVLRQVTDPMVRHYWEREYEGYDRRFLHEAIAPVQTKIGRLFMASPLRNILGQVTNRIDAAGIMDERRILIANLSKGLLGEDKANLLGAMLVTSFQLAAMARAAVPERERTPFHLYVDEFHNFATDSFAAILSEARKYGLSLVLSHQYTAQLREGIRESVFGNVGSLVSFRVGESDAQVLGREYGSGHTPHLFSSLGNYEVYCKLLDRGSPREPFRGRTLPPLDVSYGRSETIIRRSRERYGTPRRLIENRIVKWLRS